MTTMGKVAGLQGENEAIWKRFEGFVRARHKITELSGPGLSRETARPAKSAKDQARENGVDVEIVRANKHSLEGRIDRVRREAPARVSPTWRRVALPVVNA